MTRQILGRMEPLTGTEIVDRIHRLMTLRSRIDRLAWNSLAGSLQGPPSPKVQDWDDRCMMLVSIGMAFEDMPEVLEQALADPEGLSAWGSMIHRTAEAYDSLSLAYVPATWSEHSAAGGGLSDSCMWNAWTALCDEVAAIIGHEPGYGRNVVCTKPKG